MQTLQLPEVRTLSPSDVHAILARNIIGRIAFPMSGEIEIRPLSYVYGDGSIYLRSSATAKLSATDPDGTPVGFEVDEIHSMSRWVSVVVRGTLFRLRRAQQPEEWSRAVERLRWLTPVARRDRDQAPHRTEIFRLLIRDATGRAMG